MFSQLSHSALLVPIYWEEHKIQRSTTKKIQSQRAKNTENVKEEKKIVEKKKVIREGF